MSTRLHLVRHGAGPAIVFVHGLGSSTSTWDACIAALSATPVALLGGPRELVAVDLLGHGHSPVPDNPASYTRDAALADLDAVLATTSDPGRVVLVGHSLGGYLALAHVATRPGAVGGIVVLNTGPGFRDPVKREEWNERSRRNAHRFGVPEQVTGLNLQHDAVVMEQLAEIATPTLVLAGSADRPEYTASGQYLERKMASVRFVAIDGGEHSMQESHAAEVSALIAEFVRGLSH